MTTLPGHVPHRTDSPPTPRERALELASKGFRVLPLDDEGKRPLVVDAATTNRQRIEGWWDDHPDALIGLRTGRIGDDLYLVVVDVEPHGTIDPAWHETLTARTQSGGWHLYYVTREPAGCSAGQVAAGVDIRGEYVVAPGSPGWEWINPGTRVAPLPSSILESLKRWHGERSEYLARVTGWALRQGLDDVERRILAHNRRVCRPPLHDDEVRAVVASVTRREAF